MLGVGLWLMAVLPPVNPIYTPRGGEWFVGMGFVDLEGARGDVLVLGGGRWRMNTQTTLGARVGVMLTPVLVLEGDMGVTVHRKTPDIPFDFAVVPELSLGIGRYNTVVFAPRLYGALAWTFRVVNVEGTVYPFYLYLLPFLGGYFQRVEQEVVDPVTGRVVSRSEVAGEMDGGLRLAVGGRFTRRMGWDVDVVFGRFTWVFNGVLRFF